jgi:uncharacterized protein (TIGR02611 family)
VSARIHDRFASAIRASRKIAIAVAGASVLFVGVLMLVLPGPAFIVIPAGLGILGLEFAWARRWLLYGKEHGTRAIHSWRAIRDARN